MVQCILICIVHLVSLSAVAQVSYTSGTYTQDFNGLPNSGTYSLTGVGPHNVSAAPINATGATGWQLAKFAGSGANALFNVSTGSLTTGSAYSYGAAANTDRALGALSSGTVVPALGVIITNNSGGTLNSFTVNYTGEQWRNGGNNNPDTLTFQYSIGATDILTGSFITENNLSFIAPVFSATSATLDGNLPANQTVKSFTVNSITWLNGQSLVLRWTDANSTGADNGLAIDGFSFSATAPPAAPTTQDFNITFPSVAQTTLTASWTNGNGASRIVIMNTTNSFTNPVDGTSPTANTVYSGLGEQVVYNGVGSSVGVSGLTANSTYYFRVYGYNGTGGGTLYNVNTATNNPNNTTTLPAGVPTISVIGTLTPFGDVLVGNSSAEQSYTVSGTDLTNDITISCPAGFEMSLTSGSGFSGSNITLTHTLGTVATTTVYVRFTPAGLGAASGNVSNQSAGATTADLLVSGNGVEPVITTTGTLTGFGNVFVGANSTSQSYTVSGVNLQGNITVSVPADFAVSLTSGSGYTNSITLNATGLSNPGGGSVSTTTIYVRFSPLSAGLQTSNVDNASTNAVTQSLAVSGTGVTPPTMTELVVPKFMGSKSTASANNCRTPIAVCLQIDNLLANTVYDVRIGLGLTSDAASSFGAGNFWNGTSFAVTNIVGAFVTDGSGSSGPVWYYIQPTGNGTRFDAGQIHNIRFGYTVTGGTIASSPTFVGTKTITALDIPTTARTSGVTTDDGAFIAGVSGACMDGKYILLYDNTAGTGDPLFSYQARTMAATNTTQSDLPTLINDIYTQAGSTASGDYLAVIPIGANNPNGVRRIEAREADNSIAKFTTDADGIWPSGANTTTAARRDVVTITSTDALNGVSGVISGNQTICAGSNASLALTFTGTAPFFYIITDGTNNFGPYVSATTSTTKLIPTSSSVTYTLSIVSDVSCTGITSGSAVVTTVAAAPTASVIVPSITGLPVSACNGTTASLSVPSVSNASYYIWDGPSGCDFNGSGNPFTNSTPTANITFGNPNGSGYYIGVQAGNICGTSTRKVQWVRGTVSVPASIAGNLIACPNTSGNYSTTAVTGATQYLWTITGDATVSGTGINATVNFGPAFTTGTLCVAAQTSCYTSPTKCITISRFPSTVPAFSTGTFTACVGQTIQYCVPSQAGVASYNWTLPPNTSGTSTSNCINVTFNSGFTGGNISVSSVSICGDISAPRTSTIYWGAPTVPASISGPLTGLCGQTVIYTCPSQPGVTFTWTVPGGATINSGQGSNAISVTFGTFTTSTVCVTAGNACGTSASRCITVKGSPNAPGAITSIPSSWCANTAGVEFNVDVSALTGSYTLSWLYPTASVATYVLGGGNSTQLILNWITGSGPVNVTASNACGNATRTSTQANSCRKGEQTTLVDDNLQFIVNPNPTQGITYAVFVTDKKSTGLLAVYDIAGRVIIQKAIYTHEGNNNVQIDLSTVAKGVYTIMITLDDTIAKTKVIVE